MKIKVLLVLFFGITTTSFAQWQMVDSSNSNVINDFVDGGKYLFVAGGKYIATTGILKRTSDNGATWQTITNGLSEAKLNNQITGSGEEFYLQSGSSGAIGSGGIFRSVDGGLSWTKVSIGIAAYSTMELLYDGTTLIALVNNEYYISVDNGKSWTSKSKITSNASLKGLVTDGARYYTYSPALQGYYYSDDKCGTWNLSSSPNNFMLNFSTDGKNIYMVANDAAQSLYEITDQGKTLVTGKPVGGTAYSIDRIAGTGNAVFASGQFLSNYIYLSVDQMKTWKDVSAGIPGREYRIEKILVKGDFVYLGFNSVSVSSPSYQIWRRKLLDFGISTNVNVSKEIPAAFNLEQNYPNPFNPTTSIDYSIPERSNVVITIFDGVGKEIVNVVNKEQTAGFYSVTFDASKLSSGAYFYTIKAGKFSATKKMLLTK